MKLGELQELFAKLISEHILWIISKGYKVRKGDGCLLSNRKMIVDGATVKGQDAVHMNPGCHYFMLAEDLNIFKNGTWLKKGNEPDWKEIGEHWESLNPLCKWGGRFDDSNHFSITYQGKK